MSLYEALARMEEKGVLAPNVRQSLEKLRGVLPANPLTAAPASSDTKWQALAAARELPPAKGGRVE